MTIEQAQARDKIIDKITVELHAQLIELFPDILEAIARHEDRKTRVSISIPICEEEGSYALEIKTKVSSRTPKTQSEMIHVG